MASPTELLDTTAEWAVMVFSAGSMIAIALASPLSTLLAPLRNARSVAIALLANFVLVPALGYAIVHAVGLERPVALGILLTAAGAGAPFLIKLTVTAQGDTSLSATLLVLLLPATLIFMPLALPLLAPEASISAWGIARPLILMMLLPLAIGMLVRHFSPSRTRLILPWLRPITTIALGVLVVASLAGSWRGISHVGADGIGAAAILTLCGFAAGFALSTRGDEGRVVLGLGTAQRNIGAATVVATQALDDPITILTVIVTSLVGLGILFPIAWWFRRQSERRERTWPESVRRTS